jgi:hypothetical protein
MILSANGVRGNAQDKKKISRKELLASLFNENVNEPPTIQFYSASEFRMTAVKILKQVGGEMD